MKLPLYQVDAFTARLFSGNPAAVVPLTHWLDAALMQAIAAENNLSETAFFVGGGGRYALRWFTPTVEEGHFRKVAPVLENENPQHPLNPDRTTAGALGVGG